MQSTVLDINESNTTSTFNSKANEKSKIFTKRNQTQAIDMQLISQKTLKGEEETTSTISSPHSETILTGNKQSPSKSTLISDDEAVKTCVINGILNSHLEDTITDTEPAEHRSNTKVIDSSDIDVDAVRPVSMASITSSGTSRESGYFSGSSNNESPSLQIHCNGTRILIESTDVQDPQKNRFQPAKESIESVPEEREEDVKEEEKVLNEDTEKTKPQSTSKRSSMLENQVSLNNNTARERLCPRDISKRNERVSVKDINKKIGEVDPLVPMASMAMDASFQLTYIDRVILELIETERMYVRALEDILAGYLLAIKNTPGLPIKTTDAQELFGNIKDIYVFNRKFLSYLENCGYDPVKVGQHFVSQDVEFGVYTIYCTNYPISVSILTRCMKNPVMAQFFKSQQEALHHTLPLGAYMLKPVQRILKYHLILQEMVKHCDKDLENLSIIKKALTTMTHLARHINEMKRKNEDAVHIQELQSLLTNWPGDDLTTYGQIVMEGDLKLQKAKNDRLVFLFEKMILIVKRREDGFLIYKTHIMCSDLILTESTKENPLSFIISPFDNSSLHSNHHNSRTIKQHVLTARYPEEKKLWTQNIKRLIIQNHHAEIPLHAREFIMNMDKMKLDKAATTDGLKQGPPKMFSKLSTTTIDGNIFRRRSDTGTFKKAMTSRATKKKNDGVANENSNSESHADHSGTLSRTRFTFPWMNRSSSPKQEATSDYITVPEKKSPDEENPAEEDRDEKDQKFVKKKGRNRKKRNERHRESAIYKRYKRRKSQPVTDTEQHLTNKAPKSPAKEEKSNNKTLKTDWSFDDFESFEDFLSASSENSRESVSWDVQIVEAVFERFKKEEKEHEEDVTLEQEPNNKIPQLQLESQRLSSAGSDTEDGLIDSYASNETLISQSVEEMTPTDKLASTDGDSSIYQSHLSPHENVGQSRKDCEQSANYVIDDVKSIEEKENAFQREIDDVVDVNDVNSAVDVNDAVPSLESVQEPDVQGEDIAKDVDTEEEIYVEGDVDLDDDATGAQSPTRVKRSFSTQSSYSERRKYFEKLKEMRDRRHSNASLNSYDANHIIQSGLVKERIAHHREYLACLYQPQGSANPTLLKDTRFHENSNGKHESNSLIQQQDRTLQPISPHDDNLQQNSVSGNSFKHGFQSHNAQYEERVSETANQNHFSTITTSSLPLNFTSSSNSSSCSSINDTEDLQDCRSPTTPKYKVLLQPRLFLWRSYFEDNSANTRRSNSLAVQNTSKPLNETYKLSSSSEKSTNNESPQSVSLKEIEKVSTGEEKKDDLSEGVDDVWEDFETKARKFEMLSRSSSSDMLREKQPLKKSSFRTRKELAPVSTTKATTTSDPHQLQSKKPVENIEYRSTVRTTRRRYASNRCSTAEIEAADVAAASALVKRSSSYQSLITNKATTSNALSTTPILFNMNKRNESDLSSLDSTTTTSLSSSFSASANSSAAIKRSSSYRSREPVSTSSFAKSPTTVVTSLSRHSSVTSKDLESTSLEALKNELAANLTRSNSNRKKKMVALPTSSSFSRSLSSTPAARTMPVRRHSSRHLKNNATTENAETVSVTSSATSAATTTVVTSTNRRRRPASRRSSFTSSTQQSASVTAAVTTPTSSVSGEEKNVQSVEEEQPQEKKSVLMLAQRFDQIAQSSGNLSRLTGRNRWNKGRKHFSDLAFSTTDDSSKGGIDYDEVKKHAQLKRHDTFVTTICFNNKEKSQKNSVSNPALAQTFTELNGTSKSVKQPTSPKNPKSSPTIKPAPKPMLRSRSAITASFVDDTGIKSSSESPKPIVGPMTKACRDVLPAAPASSLEKSEEIEEKPKKAPPSDFVSRFCKT